MPRSKTRVRFPHDGSNYNAQECKKALIGWAAKATSVRNATNHLEAWRESLKFVLLFKKYFAVQYEELTSKPDVWILDPRSHIAPIESKFFDLVEQHLFPISVDWMEMILQEIHNGDDIIPHIPLISLLPRSDEWDSEAPEYDAIQVLLCFTWNNWLAPDENGWQALHERFLAHDVTLPAPNWYPWRGETFRLDIESRVRDALMAAHQSVFFEMARHDGFTWLRTTMEVLFRETGNALVDYDEETMMEALDWTEENIEWLAEEWRQGQKMMNTFWDGIHQMLSHPTMCARLIELWNTTWSIAPRAIVMARA